MAGRLGALHTRGMYIQQVRSIRSQNQFVKLRAGWRVQRGLVVNDVLLKLVLSDFLLTDRSHSLKIDDVPHIEN